ncbi:MAG: PaaI family thioesterase [Firmicutes bacterium]|nr:PaaI family thioesterase [Bacillota bacterium]
MMWQNGEEMKDNKQEQLIKVLQENVMENSYMKFLGIEFVKLEDGYSLAKMKYRKDLTNPYGILHGGCLYSFADIAAGTTACMCGNYVTTVSGTLNFLLPAVKTEYVFCESTRLRQGKHLAVFDVKIKDDENQILDSGEFTFFIMDQEVISD